MKAGHSDAQPFREGHLGLVAPVLKEISRQSVSQIFHLWKTTVIGIIFHTWKMGLGGWSMTEFWNVYFVKGFQSNVWWQAIPACVMVFIIPVALLAISYLVLGGSRKAILVTTPICFGAPILLTALWPLLFGQAFVRLGDKDGVSTVAPYSYVLTLFGEASPFIWVGATITVLGVMLHPVIRWLPSELEEKPTSSEASNSELEIASKR